VAALDVESLKRKAVAAYKAFTPPQLIIIGLLAAFGVGGVLFFASWASKPSYNVLFTGLQAKDASAITQKLTADGVSYQLAANGTTVLVPAADVAKERLALSATGLPSGGSQGWSLMDSQGLTSSSFQQQVAYQRALEGEIDKTLNAMTGVSNAQVHLVMPSDSVFTQQQQPARASVMLDTTGSFSSSQVQSVVALVSGAVPNLDPSAVTVTDANGKLLSKKSDAASSANDAKSALEDQNTTAAQTMLDQLLGAGHSIVRVTADVNTSQQTIDSETYDKNSAVPLAQQSTSEIYGQGSTAAGGTVTVTSTTAASASPGTGNYNQNSTTTQYGVNRTVNHQVVAPGGLKRLSVAVAVDSNAKNLPPSSQIQQLVAAAVGADPTRGDSVVVTSTAFDTAATAATAPKSSGSSLTSGALLARSLRKPKVTEIDLPENLTGGALPAGGRPALVPAQRSALGGADSPAGLLDAVENSPDDVAALLKGWLSESGTNR
jgi:flagellar M-ring protein FliF